MIGFQKSVERRPPNTRGRFPAFFYDRFEKSLRHCFSQSALLKFKRKVAVNRICKVRYGIAKFHRTLLAMEAEDRPYKHKPLYALGVIQRKTLGDVAAHT